MGFKISNNIGGDVDITTGRLECAVTTDKDTVGGRARHRRIGNRHPDQRTGIEDHFIIRRGIDIGCQGDAAFCRSCAAHFNCAVITNADTVGLGQGAPAVTNGHRDGPATIKFEVLIKPCLGDGIAAGGGQVMGIDGRIIAEINFSYRCPV